MRSVVLLFVAAGLGAGCAPSTHDLAARGELGLLHARLQEAPETTARRDDWGKTPLHIAVSFKQLEAMAMLLDAGSDINAPDATGMTPLHVAAMLGRQQELRWLLRHGADPVARDRYGDTPLHTAARYGQGGTMAALRDTGAPLAAHNDAEQTPLDLARLGRHDRVAAYLEHLSRGN